MGEAKKRRDAGGPQERWMTIGVVATRWDHAPQVGVATACIKVPVRDITRLANRMSKNFTRGDAVRALKEAFDANLQTTDIQQFAMVAATYVGMTDALKGAVARREDGFWFKIMARGDACKARIVATMDADGLRSLMEKVQSRREELTADELIHFVYSDHPDDEKITGRVEVRGCEVLRNDQQIVISGDWGAGKSMSVH